jgi:hypothetical protein
MKLKRYDVRMIDAFGETELERDYYDGGDHVDAYEALDIITVQKERIEELEAEKQKLIDLFKNCRDSTGYSDTYFRGMYNGIEWARSCLEKNEPEYKDSIEKSVPIYVPTVAEMTEER